MVTVESWQIILQVGCEGGDLTLYGRQLNAAWKFKMVTDETSYKEIFKEEDLCGELINESDAVTSWREAVRLLNKYPYWPSLYPLKAHSEFTKEIYSTLIELTSASDYPTHMGDLDWDQWNKVLYGNVEEDQSVDDYYEKAYFVNSVPPPSGRLIVKRNARSITRRIPKPYVLVDTRERDPFCFDNLSNWIAGAKVQTLKTGDYSIEGMESLLVLERKSLPDLVSTLIHERKRFFKQCELMTEYRWRAILVEASYEDVKSPYGEYTQAHPNAVSGTLDALEAKFGIPVIYTSRYKPLAEEKAASWLSKLFTYWHLESNGMGRVLQEGDL